MQQTVIYPMKRRLKKITPNVSYDPIVIENVSPSVDGGLYSVKCIAGDWLQIEADIFKEGTDVLGAEILLKKKSAKDWQRISMRPGENDRWEGTVQPGENAAYVYKIEAWSDPLKTWIRDAEKKSAAFTIQENEVEEGACLLAELIREVPRAKSACLNSTLALLKMAGGAPEEVLRLLSSAEFKRCLEKHSLRRNAALSREYPLTADRKKAEFSAWYEFFPRSQGKTQNKSGTFQDCLRRLPEIKRMGFNVVYLPPIHPIGITKRKGKNNALKADKLDPGSPWAIGNAYGGHKAIHSELGTLADFENFVDACHDYGIEVALDLAYQCSPDHPYVKRHPEWFYHLPDGTIRTAENPPKKYEDIYPIDFYNRRHKELWLELKSVVLFWISKGVKIFRVDNPHTKPLRFWEWLIREVQLKHPDVIFLAEAFTRPKVMRFLAKAGFTQSYTYFTWRNQKHEIREYLEELTRPEMSYYFRGNFFANTPDILSEYLQHGGRPAFKIRAVLASTLSSNYGIYSGYELCENIAKKPGSEEYLNSEKYEIKQRNWDAPGNIKVFLAQLNHIRAQNPALQQFKNLEFFDSSNSAMLCYGKRTADNSNILVIAVNLDPHQAQEDWVTLPIEKFGIQDWQTYQMKDLLTGEKYYWRGSRGYLRLDPQKEPAHIFLLRK